MQKASLATAPRLQQEGKAVAIVKQGSVGSKQAGSAVVVRALSGRPSPTPSPPPSSSTANSLLVLAIGGLRRKCRIAEHVDGPRHRHSRVVAQLRGTVKANRGIHTSTRSTAAACRAPAHVLGSRPPALCTGPAAADTSALRLVCYRHPALLCSHLHQRHQREGRPCQLGVSLGCIRAPAVGGGRAAQRRKRLRAVKASRLPTIRTRDCETRTCHGSEQAHGIQQPARQLNHALLRCARGSGAPSHCRARWTGPRHGRAREP